MYATDPVLGSLANDAADNLEHQAAEIDRLETLVDQLQWENKGVAEWRAVAKELRDQMILEKHMKITIEFDSLQELNEFIEWQGVRRSAIKTPIRNSGLTGLGLTALIDSGIEFIEDAQRLSDAELLRIPCFGRKALNALRELENPSAN